MRSENKHVMWWLLSRARKDENSDECKSSEIFKIYTVSITYKYLSKLDTAVCIGVF